MDIQTELEEKLLEKRIILLNKEVDKDGPVQEKICASLEYLNSISNEEITLKIDSDGGNHYLGNIIIDHIRQSPSPVHGIGTGYVSSMAFNILQSCHKTSAFGLSRLMFHPYRINDLSIWNDNFDGIVKSLKDDFHFFLERLSEKSGQSFIDLTTWAKQERVFYGYEAKELGFIDHLIEKQ